MYSNTCILKTRDDWEGFYIDGNLMAECVSFERSEKYQRLLNSLLFKHELEMKDISKHILSDTDKAKVIRMSGFPSSIAELKGVA